jgi:PhnB protein
MAVHEVFPYLHVKDARAAIDFYTRVFGAREKFRLAEPGGRIGHAELDFDGATVMLSDEYPELNIRGPRPGEPASITLHLHVDDADAMVARAVAAGATLEMAPRDHFYGERSGSFRDPFGHRWNVGHSIEQISPDEMQRRYTKELEGTG